MKSNSDIVSKGFLMAAKIVRDQVRTRFEESGKAFIEHAMSERGYLSFTGNTITSLAFGVYENKKLYKAYVAVRDMKDPLRKKIPLGKVVFLEVPYEGSKRRAKGRVEVDNQFGYEESMSFIRKYRPSSNGYALVVTTGTEYSEYLEQEKGLNVLTDTFMAGRSGLVTPIMIAPI